ncbi:D-glycero-alpha-D-manno-heptose-1,7-bisphosphate 7-phosphatase [Sphingomonas sp. CV7422]|uniref:D-glycero-alpha-D-manno-heptose-1,7-bisphosphate 7-phosphatase n=1 Tax=Sphingomonas sp. CV7422 TaxID=3018036 RepID=UPI0022FDE1CC|nr:HAD family hydrolase [Sphingomonas sp. CV7422]
MIANRPAAFFDRDGVINVDHGYIDTPARFDLVKGAAAALRACREAGLLVFVVTNQSGIARGYFDEAALNRVHTHMHALLGREGAVIDDVRFCPHHVEAAVAAYRHDCDWRKPAPGMILDLTRHWRVDLTRSFLIGDKPSDMTAAAAAGVTGFQFLGGDLLAFVTTILDGRSSQGMLLSPHGSEDQPA